MNNLSVSICFPAYNEEETIADVLRDAHDLLVRSGLDYEILVCNDGSSDRTGTIIKSLAQQIPHLRVLEHAQNQGIRATFEHLYSKAIKEFVFLNSTDRQWRTSILFDLLPLTKDWDIIIASRINKHYTFVRRFVSWTFNILPFFLFGVRTFDAGAVKLVRREIIERFELVSRSPFSEVERIIRASRAGYRITEYPVEIATRNTGQAHGVSFGLVREAIIDVARTWASLHQNQNGAIKVKSSVIQDQSLLSIDLSKTARHYKHGINK